MTTECALGHLSEHAQRINLCECKSDVGSWVPITTLSLINFAFLCVLGYITHNASPNGFSFHFTPGKQNHMLVCWKAFAIQVFIPIF